MTRKMRVLVLGASGGCGRWVARLAAERGHDVTALVRQDTPYAPPSGVQVQRGEALDAEVLQEAVAGHDVVFSCLGLKRSSRSLWAKLLSPPDLVSRVIRQLATIMPEHGVRRLVVISAAGVGSSRTKATWPVRRLISLGNVAVGYSDLERMESELGETELDWLAVRPVTLVGGEPTGRAGPVDRYALFSTIRRADVAGWMVDAAEASPPFETRQVMLGTTS